MSAADDRALGVTLRLVYWSGLAPLVRRLAGELVRRRQVELWNHRGWERPLPQLVMSRLREPRCKPLGCWCEPARPAVELWLLPVDGRLFLLLLPVDGRLFGADGEFVGRFSARPVRRAEEGVDRDDGSDQDP